MAKKTKTCKICGFTCDYNDANIYFYRNAEIYFCSNCKVCAKSRQQTSEGKVATTIASLKWAKQNPDKTKAKMNRRRARRLLLPDNFTNGDVDFALNYWNYQCPVCQSDLSKGYHLDHHIPLSSDQCTGTIPANIIPLCQLCNNSKYDKLPEVWYQDKQEILNQIKIFLSLTRQIK